MLRAASPLSLASTLTLKLKTYRAHLAVQMNLDWPENVYTLLAYLGLLDFDVDVSSPARLLTIIVSRTSLHSRALQLPAPRAHVVLQVSGPDCLVAWSWRHDFYFQLCLPLAVAVINIIQYLFCHLLARFPPSAGSRLRVRIFAVLGVPSGVDPEQRATDLRALRGDIFAKVISFTNIIYMTLVRYCIGAFVCMDIKDGLQVLTVYPDIECYTPLHDEIRGVAAAGIVLYVFGFPLGVLFSLVRVGGKQHHSIPSKLRKYGGVYDRYESHAYAPAAAAPLCSFSIIEPWAAAKCA